MTAVQAHAVIQPTTLAEIEPALDQPFHNPIDKFSFWIGRTFFKMLPMRIIETAIGGVHQVAETFRKQILDAVIETRRLQERGEARAANRTLYCAAYDLTLLNQSQIRALAAGLTPSPDQLENSTLVAAMKRAELLSRLPEITAAIRHLINSFDTKMQQAAHVEPLPLPPPAQSRRSYPLAAVDVPVAPLDRAAAIQSKEMPSPAERHANRTEVIPNITPDKLVRGDFTSHLKMKEIWDMPDYTAVQALGAHLDTFDEAKVGKLLRSFGFMELLYLYEVTTVRQPVVVTVMAEKYHAIADEAEHQKLRAYLTRFNKTKQGVDYDAILAKMPQ